MPSLLGSRKIDTRQLQFLQADQNLCAQKLRAYLVHHFQKGFVVRLYSFHTKPCIAEISNISVYRSGICDARNPRQQSTQLLGQYRAARQIAQTNATTTTKYPRKFTRRSGLVWKGAERALADDSVERGIRERQPFRIAASEVNTLYPGLLP